MIFNVVWFCLVPYTLSDSRHIHFANVVFFLAKKKNEIKMFECSMFYSECLRLHSDDSCDWCDS